MNRTHITEQDRGMSKCRYCGETILQWETRCLRCGRKISVTEDDRMRAKETDEFGDPCYDAEK